VATASGPVSMDRTEELYQKLEQSADGEVQMDLDQFDYVLSPASTHRKVYGPADLLVKRWPDGGIDMHVAISGKRPVRRAPDRIFTDSAGGQHVVPEDWDGMGNYHEA
jgi:hypothetical protein